MIKIIQKLLAALFGALTISSLIVFNIVGIPIFGLLTYYFYKKSRAR